MTKADRIARAFRVLRRAPDKRLKALKLMSYWARCPQGCPRCMREDGW
jgi:hypothetical protein